MPLHEKNLDKRGFQVAAHVCDNVKFHSWKIKKKIVVEGNADNERKAESIVINTTVWKTSKYVRSHVWRDDTLNGWKWCWRWIGEQKHPAPSRSNAKTVAKDKNRFHSVKKDLWKWERVFLLKIKRIFVLKMRKLRSFNENYIKMTQLLNSN